MLYTQVNYSQVDYLEHKKETNFLYINALMTEVLQKNVWQSATKGYIGVVLALGIAHVMFFIGKPSFNAILYIE